MRHNKKHGMKLGTDASHTKAMKKSLTSALLANDRIKTTQPRAKAIRTDVDRVITWAKKGDLHSRRLAIAKLGDKELVREVFEKAAQGMWEGRNGGYTRIMKLGRRKGDNAEIVIIELVRSSRRPRRQTPSSRSLLPRLRSRQRARRHLLRLPPRRPLQSSICCIGAHVREVLGNQGLSSAIEELCPCGEMLLRDWEYVA